MNFGYPFISTFYFGYGSIPANKKTNLKHPFQYLFYETHGDAGIYIHVLVDTDIDLAMKHYYRIDFYKPLSRQITNGPYR